MKDYSPCLKKTISIKNSSLFVLLLSLALIACNGTSPENSTTPTTSGTNPEPAETPTETPPDNRPPLYLSGLYATSTAPGKDVRSVFDKDENTIWQTMRGAGPDEGVMLYFAEETYIKSIRIERAMESGLSAISEVLVYGNGAPLADSLGTFDVSVDQKVYNVYLRFNTNQNIETTNRKLEEDYYEAIELTRFDTEKSIGIKSIIIEGEEGEYRVVPPQLVKGEVTASSTLNAESFAYDPSLLFDARKEFVWVEGEKGNGEGVKLAFEFEEAVSIAGLHIWNGYQRSDSHFKSNARLKSFGFGEAGGALETFDLEDQVGMQMIRLNKAIKAKRFELEIQSAFKGRSYKDLAISELLFFDEANALFGLDSKRPEANREKIIAQSKGTVLEHLLDSRVFNEYSAEYIEGGLTRSAILRSDGTFVLYSSEINEDSGGSYETIADGNWEILAADEATAELNVFGKLLDFSELEMFYAGKTDAELSRIFRDKISIKNNTIKGAKLVNALEF